MKEVGTIVMLCNTNPLKKQ